VSQAKDNQVVLFALIAGSEKVAAGLAWCANSYPAVRTLTRNVSTACALDPRERYPVIQTAAAPFRPQDDLNCFPDW
jgi:hypothetical protein